MKFVYIKDNAISPEWCEKIIKCFELNKSQHEPGLISNKKLDKNSKISRDWSKKFSNIDFIDTKIKDTLIENINEYHKFVKGINMVTDAWDIDDYYIIQKYKPGEGFKSWHHEHGGYKNFPEVDSVRRVLAWMVYLNDVPDGGTEFMDQETTIEAKVGRLLIWPAYWTHTHRSQISYTLTKYIATGWCLFN